MTDNTKRPSLVVRGRGRVSIEMIGTIPAGTLWERPPAAIERLKLPQGRGLPRPCNQANFLPGEST
jgi:hypothetical protein